MKRIQRRSGWCNGTATREVSSRIALFASLLTLAACDDKKETPEAGQSAAVSAVPPIPSAPPVASAAPAASAEPQNVAVTHEGSDDVSFSSREPSKDDNKTVKVKTGGAFTMYLPDSGGNSWGADSFGTLGKPKEESMPGFDKGVLGHMFKWSGVKAGKTTITFGLRKAAAKGKGETSQTFKVTLDVS